MITIPKPGIFIALGGSSNTPIGLRKELLTVEGVNAFWDDLEAITHTIGSVCFHRMYGEPNPRDAMDFDSVYQIEQSTDPVVRDYYQAMRRRFEAYALAHPEIRIDFYVGSLLCNSMLQLLSEVGTIEERERRATEWKSRWSKQIDPITQLIDKGANIRIVFDHSSTYDRDSLEWFYLSRLDQYQYDRVVIEAMPTRNEEQRPFPCFAMELAYQRQKGRANSDMQDVTRVYNDVSGASSMLDFLIDCAEHGHKALIYDMRLRGTTLEAVHQGAIEQANRATEID